MSGVRDCRIRNIMQLEASQQNSRCERNSAETETPTPKTADEEKGSHADMVKEMIDPNILKRSNREQQTTIKEQNTDTNSNTPPHTRRSTPHHHTENGFCDNEQLDLAQWNTVHRRGVNVVSRSTRAL